MALPSASRTYWNRNLPESFANARYPIDRVNHSTSSIAYCEDATARVTDVVDRHSALSFELFQGFRHDTCIVATLGGHEQQKAIPRGVAACVSRMARPKVKSNKKDTFTYRQERNDMSGRTEAAKAAIEGVSSIENGLQRSILRLKS
jgi:hypothetical protein